jgi:hypothetical protein
MKIIRNRIKNKNTMTGWIEPKLGSSQAIIKWKKSGKINKTEMNESLDNL